MGLLDPVLLLPCSEGRERGLLLAEPLTLEVWLERVEEFRAVVVDMV